MRNLLITMFLVANTAAAATPAPPETILGLARAKPGKEAELLQALHDDQATMERLGLITWTYTIYRGSDEGCTGTVFVVSFTWKSGDIPDNAPPEVRQSWKRIGSFLEKPKNGAPAREFWIVDTIETIPSPSK